MKKLIIIAVLAAICLMFFIGSSEPELVVDNSYKHRGTYSGNMNLNTYTFEIKNDCRRTDIESLDYFRILFYDSDSNLVYTWRAGSSDLKELALSSGDSVRFQINISEKTLSYYEDWSYEIEYYLYYYE